jgi:hypothetical protein
MTACVSRAWEMDKYLEVENLDGRPVFTRPRRAEPTAHAWARASSSAASSGTTAVGKLRRRPLWPARETEDSGWACRISGFEHGMIGRGSSRRARTFAGSPLHRITIINHDSNICI